MAHWDMYLDDEQVERLIKMYHAHQPLALLIMKLAPVMAKFNGHKGLKLELPLSASEQDYSDLPVSLISRTGYRELLTEYCTPILEEFWHFKDVALSRKKANHPTFR